MRTSTVASFLQPISLLMSGPRRWGERFRRAEKGDPAGLRCRPIGPESLEVGLENAEQGTYGIGVKAGRSQAACEHLPDFHRRQFIRAEPDQPLQHGAVEMNADCPPGCIPVRRFEWPFGS